MGSLDRYSGMFFLFLCLTLLCNLLASMGLLVRSWWACIVSLFSPLHV